MNVFHKQDLLGVEMHSNRQPRVYTRAYLQVGSWVTSDWVAVPRATRRNAPRVYISTNSLLLRFSLRLARALFRDHFYYFYYYFELGVSSFLDIQHLKHARD